MFLDCMENKACRYMSVMFKVLNSGDVWVAELGIGHALSMRREASGRARSFAKLTKGV